MKLTKISQRGSCTQDALLTQAGEPLLASSKLNSRLYNLTREPCERNTGSNTIAQDISIQMSLKKATSRCPIRLLTSRSGKLRTKSRCKNGSKPSKRSKSLKWQVKTTLNKGMSFGDQSNGQEQKSKASESAWRKQSSWMKSIKTRYQTTTRRSNISGMSSSSWMWMIRLRSPKKWKQLRCWLSKPKYWKSIRWRKLWPLEKWLSRGFLIIRSNDSQKKPTRRRQTYTSSNRK